MGKRSEFPRRKNDAYETPYKCVLPLIPHLRGIETFAEPCCGDGALISHLTSFGLYCAYRADIETGTDALIEPPHGSFDAIITNPPWTRELLHPMITTFQQIAPTWLLFDADWPFTKQSARFLDQCSHIVAVGRVKWIVGSAHFGKDNASWFRFHAQHVGGPRFYGPMIEQAAA